MWSVSFEIFFLVHDLSWVFCSFRHIFNAFEKQSPRFLSFLYMIVENLMYCLYLKLKPSIASSNNSADNCQFSFFKPDADVWPWVLLLSLSKPKISGKKINQMSFGRGIKNQTWASSKVCSCLASQCACMEMTFLHRYSSNQFLKWNKPQ